MGDRIKLNIIGLTSSHSQRNSYTLILGEENGELKLPIVIGGYEAQSIALVIEGLKPQRPLTHDLISNFFSQFGIILKEVIINKLEEGVFFSTLVTEKDDKIQNIDARTSDAIALALRMKCPIYTYKSILNDAGIQYEENDIEGEEKEEIIEDENTPVVSNDLNQLSLKELEAELEKAIKIEDYVRAALLRDEIKIRK
ncbi:bifunctional nuclease family protein [Bacteroidia bacterium]|nr:bifunctional nuclease family protein [Bacteroidia bacterium]MDC0561625.1 bifunctional nuclease family protein [Bacteroidia bacterium]MDC3406557.1 bifunctional nuclease family protein [Bacteroidia bacterium]